MRFWKAHGSLNDFVLVLEEDLPERADPSELAVEMCDRRAGVGADGLILVDVEPPEVRMRVFNPDGSEAEFCGNAARCVVLLAHEILGENVNRLRSGAGVHEVTIEDETISVEVPGAEVKEVNELGYEVRAGVPHLVRLTEQDPLDPDPRLRKAASVIRDDIYGGDINVTFACPVEGNVLRVRTFERGAGWTPACGSGVVAASVVYLEVYEGGEGSVEVKTKGGELKTEVEGDRVKLIGPAEITFEGRWLKLREDPDN